MSSDPNFAHSQVTERFNVIVIGAGAAGLMCALTAGQRGRRVLLLDHADRVGKKILISGGGRCNFTNLQVEPENYLSGNPHFCKSALSRFGPHDFIALVEKHGIPYHEKTLGQLFCNGKSTAIVTLLLEECRLGGVQIETNNFVEKIEQRNIAEKSHFTVKTNLGSYHTESLVIATGGLSIPKMGATDFGYRVAKQFGLAVRPCRPGLVSFTLNQRDLQETNGLSGTSADALVSCKEQAFRESILFTHKGLSGPAILQISNYWEPGDAITINLLPDFDLAEAIKKWQTERPKAELKNLIGERLTKRLAQQWLALSCENKPVKQYYQKEIEAISARFHQWRIIPSGTSGYPVAEVTKGGVDTDELSSKTFEAKHVKGLYFIGEVVDVTGWLGGYNFQWAWASGRCAGLFV
ncbi:MAG: NAD(P)/FAD-dependent oxidoreductase [Nitrospirae bacterium]|nr:NAD(P)/FAD-dependent oxidoreductase [Nitrospirota bacterium]MBI3352421.1 NAD(P)/FAD-dependent oxidoreductase [Nitrospirota bacterium]